LWGGGNLPATGKKRGSKKRKDRKSCPGYVITHRRKKGLQKPPGNWGSKRTPRPTPKKGFQNVGGKKVKKRQGKKTSPERGGGKRIYLECEENCWEPKDSGGGVLFKDGRKRPRLHRDPIWKQKVLEIGGRR